MSQSEQFQNVPTFATLYEAFLTWPTQTQVGLVMFAATWLVGGNIVIYFSMKRRGIPYWRVFVPSYRFKLGLNAKEYVILAVLACLSLGFAMWGISAQLPLDP